MQRAIAKTVIILLAMMIALMFIGGKIAFDRAILIMVFLTLNTVAVSGGQNG